MISRARFSRFWLPALAGLLGLCGTVALFYMLREHDAEQARRIGEIAATSIRNDMEADLNAHFLLQMQALSPTSFDQRLTQDAWEAQARLFLKINPNFVALEWIDAANHRVWSAPAYPHSLQVAADDRVQRLLQSVGGQEHGLALSSPAPLPDAERLRELVVPGRRHGKLEGFVVAWIRVKGLLDVVLDDATSLGYCVSIQEAEGEIYRAPVGCTYSAEFVEVQSVPLNWRARIWPMTEYAANLRSRAPALALALGCSFSLLLVFTVYFAESAQMRNASLVTEIAQREKTEEELQRTQRELESRVESRTAELSKLSAELLELRDQERRLVSHQLQEGTAQHLAALALNLAVLEQLADASNENVRTALQRSMTLIQQSSRELGELAAVLHPPLLEHLGLASTVRWYADIFRLRTGVPVELDMEPEIGRLSHELELTLFRIVQEGLAVLHEHVPGGPAQIRLSRNSSGVALEISVQRDPAAGAHDLPPDALERGVAPLRERARKLGGSVRVDVDPKTATLRAELPLK